jgi:transposase-like protein
MGPFFRRRGFNITKSCCWPIPARRTIAGTVTVLKEHWVHLRTTNIVESPFSSVRLRIDAAKRFRKMQSARTMIWKLLQVAEKTFPSLRGYGLLTDVYEGKRFVDGISAHEPKSLERLAA